MGDEFDYSSVDEALNAALSDTQADPEPPAGDPAGEPVEAGNVESPAGVVEESTPVVPAVQDPAADPDPNRAADPASAEGQMIPYSRFAEVVTQRNALETQLAESRGTITQPSAEPAPQAAPSAPATPIMELPDIAEDDLVTGAERALYAFAKQSVELINGLSTQVRTLTQDQASRQQVELQSQQQEAQQKFNTAVGEVSQALGITVAQADMDAILDEVAALGQAMPTLTIKDGVERALVYRYRDALRSGKPAPAKPDPAAAMRAAKEGLVNSSSTPAPARGSAPVEDSGSLDDALDLAMKQLK